jgi:hypothetical protein
MDGISNIYKKHIEKYINKINSIKLNWGIGHEESIWH